MRLEDFAELPSIESGLCTIGPDLSRLFRRFCAKCAGEGGTHMTASTTAMEQTIRAALRDCYDPTLPCNIVDLGVIESITLTPDPEAPGATIPGVPQKFRVA